MRTSIVLFLALAPACIEPAAGDTAGDTTLGDLTAGASDSGGDHEGEGHAIDGVPCDVAAVIATGCHDCHSDPPKYGAPMKLTSDADFAAPAVSDPSRTVAELSALRIRDLERPMPPAGDLAPDDEDLLLAWLDGGATPEPGAHCEHAHEQDPEVGPDQLGCDVTHRFTAHADGSDAPYPVPQQGADNLYQCFAFRSPFDGTTQATAWAPIVDDERVLHHWILYRTRTPQGEGAVGPCQMPSDAVFVAGWAPGGQNYALPEDVGLELAGPDEWFLLQVHYHNTAHLADARDASGVALCTTDTPRANKAGIVSLGTLNIDIPAGAERHEVSGTCPSWQTGLLTRPLNLITSFPHMHELGRSFRTEILRGGETGPAEPLIDVPAFSFQDQRFYPHEPAVTLQPGDALRTTCTYDNPGPSAVHFGERTEDEMCFNFLLLYPIEAVGDSRSCGLL
jgi:hypothetical protein